jgi:hypothetical protein
VGRKAHCPFGYRFVNSEQTTGDTMNGLREHRAAVAQEDAAKRFARIEEKLDELLTKLDPKVAAKAEPAKPVEPPKAK